LFWSGLVPPCCCYFLLFAGFSLGAFHHPIHGWPS
jgi:hypothetical protein